MTTTVPVWLLASAALDRPCPVDEPYPHVCGTRPGSERLTRKDCMACSWRTRGPK